jgi:hypothetical protein
MSGLFEDQVTFPNTASMATSQHTLPLRHSVNVNATASSSNTDTPGTQMETMYIPEGLPSSRAAIEFSNAKKFTPLGRDNKVKTRVMVLSDTWDVGLESSCITANGHFKNRIDFSHRGVKTFTFEDVAPPVDVLIHCGNWSNSKNPLQYFATLDALDKYPAERKLFLPASDDVPALEHPIKGTNPYDTFYTALRFHPEGKSPTRFNPETKSYGSIQFLEEGSHLLTLKNGAIMHIFASPYSPGDPMKGCFYYDEEEKEDRFESWPVLIPPLIDVLITRGPPYNVLDERKSDGEFTGDASLLRAVSVARPQLHCFGGPIEDNGLEQFRWGGEAPDDDLPWRFRFTNVFPKSFHVGTKYYENGLNKGHESYMLNASIREPGGKPGVWNPPWIVDLFLHRPLYLERPRKKEEEEEEEERTKASDDVMRPQGRTIGSDELEQLKIGVEGAINSALEKQATVSVSLEVTIKVLE